MGEGVAHLADLAASRPAAGLGGPPAPSQPSPGKPGMPPRRPRSGRVLDHQRPPSALRQPEGALRVGFTALGALRGRSAAMPCARALAVPAQRADAAGRVARGADRGAQIHHRLGVVAGPWLGVRRGGQAGEVGLGGGRGVSPRTGATRPARHCRRPPSRLRRRRWRPRRRRYRGRCRAGRAGRRAWSGKPPPWSRHGARAFQQVARPGIIAKPRPFRHHLRIFGRRQRLHRRPARGEAAEIVAHRGDGGLLQHHLGQPDAVGVGPQPGGAVLRADAPGHHPGMRSYQPKQAGIEASLTQVLSPHPTRR
jgi:hypothetical protein